MFDLQVHIASDLSSEERAVVEKLLGHELDDNIRLGVQTYPVIREAPTGKARKEAARKLRESMDALASDVDPSATADELDTLINEAVRRERR